MREHRSTVFNVEVLALERCAHLVVVAVLLSLRRPAFGLNLHRGEKKVHTLLSPGSIRSTRPGKLSAHRVIYSVERSPRRRTKAET